MSLSNHVFKTLLGELKEGLVQTYGARLKGTFLFGSYARGEQRTASDVDVLIILDHVDHYAAEVDRSGELISELSLKYGLSISRVFVSEGDWCHRKTPFLINARDEAIPV
jgi:uncharacterized protein